MSLSLNAGERKERKSHPCRRQNAWVSLRVPLYVLGHIIATLFHVRTSQCQPPSPIALMTRPLSPIKDVFVRLFPITCKRVHVHTDNSRHQLRSVTATFGERFPLHMLYNCTVCFDSHRIPTRCRSIAPSLIVIAVLKSLSFSSAHDKQTRPPCPNSVNLSSILSSVNYRRAHTHTHARARAHTHMKV